jgi:hypothetical protein
MEWLRILGLGSLPQAPAEEYAILHLPIVMEKQNLL